MLNYYFRLLTYLLFRLDCSFAETSESKLFENVRAELFRSQVCFLPPNQQSQGTEEKVA